MKTKEAPAKSTSEVPVEPAYKLELTKELMVFLSKEIETTMNSITAFRTKVGFGMFVGPFVLLGSIFVGAKGQPVSFNLGRDGRVALVVAFLCYLGIGFLAAKIEAQAYAQCNKWRQLILDLRKKPFLKIDDKYLNIKPKPYWGYLGGFALLAVSVLAAALIIKNAGTVPSPNSAESGATIRTEPVLPQR